mmetsp:Transcript_67789/g.196022  ORF Transcript_67789/g.196022 Transcript_67789/m.196022 type:complete len:109 (-) Transcript_67789:2568-2894(-)
MGHAAIPADGAPALPAAWAIGGTPTCGDLKMGVPDLGATARSAIVGVCCRTGVGAAGMVDICLSRDGVPSRGVTGVAGAVALDVIGWPDAIGPGANTELPLQYPDAAC